MKDIEWKETVRTADHYMPPRLQNTGHFEGQGKALFTKVRRNLRAVSDNPHMREYTPAVNNVECFILKRKMLAVGQQETFPMASARPYGAAVAAIDPDTFVAVIGEQLDIYAGPAPYRQDAWLAR